MENSNAAARKKQHIRADSSRLSEKSGRQSRNGPTRSAWKTRGWTGYRTSVARKKGSRAAPSGTGARVSSRDNGRGTRHAPGKKEKRRRKRKRIRPAGRSPQRKDGRRKEPRRKRERTEFSFFSSMFFFAVFKNATADSRRGVSAFFPFIF